MSLLQNLAQFAVASNFAKPQGGPRLFEITVEEARAKVVVRDGNKTPAKDGSQALTLALGKNKLSLEVIAAGATRVNATKEQVEDFTAQLLAAVQAGEFDAAIAAAQAEIKATAEAPKKVKVATVVTSESGEAVQDAATEGAEVPEAVEGIDGLDLSSL